MHHKQIHLLLFICKVNKETKDKLKKNRTLIKFGNQYTTIRKQKYTNLSKCTQLEIYTVYTNSGGFCKQVSLIYYDLSQNRWIVEQTFSKCFLWKNKNLMGDEESYNVEQYIL